MNKTLKCCVIGLGHWGPNIIRALSSHPQAEVVAAADFSEKRRAVVAEKIPGLALYSTFNECLAETSFDAVAIATQTETHFELGVKALEAGKHLFMEKPLTATSAEGVKLCRMAKEKGLTLMTGHVYLHNNGIIQMKEIADSGELGKLLYFRSVRTNLGPIREDVNALWDLAPHDISIFNYVFDGVPKKVACRAFPILGGENEDIVQGTLYYSNDRVALFFVSWLDPCKIRTMTLVGDKKMLIFDDMLPDSPLRLLNKGVKKEPKIDYSDTFETFRMSIVQGEESQPAVKFESPLEKECANFVESVLNGKAPRTDGENGLEVVAVLEALDRSLRDDGKSMLPEY